jgi:hypothetical protein
MKLVVIESPYAGNTEKNVEYARLCLEDSLNRGEAPFASHLLYPQVLDDARPAQRRLGIAAGHEWLRQAHLVAFYIDHGISPGMKEAQILAENLGIPTEMRTIISEKGTSL